MAAGKRRSVVLLALAAVFSMSLWFVSAAILPEIVAEGGLAPGRAAALSSAVQIGFVIGALALAVHGTADRHDPRRVGRSGPSDTRDQATVDRTDIGDQPRTRRTAPHDWPGLPRGSTSRRLRRLTAHVQSRAVP